MAPSIIYNNAALGEVVLPGQIFVFGGFALRANSLGHLEQIDSYAPGHQVRFGSLNYMADIRADVRNVIQAPKSDLMAGGVAIDLLQVAKRVGPQCEAAEHEDLSGEEGFSLDHVITDD